MSDSLKPAVMYQILMLTPMAESRANYEAAAKAGNPRLIWAMLSAT